MNLVALIFAFSFSLFHISDTYMVEHYETEIREVYVSRISLDTKKVTESAESQSLFIPIEERFYFQHYNYVPVTKHLFLKTRTLLL